MALNLSDALAVTELTLVSLTAQGQIEHAEGPYACLFTVDEQIIDMMPFLAGLESELELIVRGDRPTLNLPNMSLPQAAPGETFDLRLAAHQDGLILALQARGAQAEVDQSLMQARNDLHLLVRERDAARRAAEVANRSKDQLLLMMREHVRDPLASLCMTLDTLQPELRLLDPALADLAQSSGGEARSVLRALDALVGASDVAAGLSALQAQEVSAKEAWRLVQRAGRKVGAEVPAEIGQGDMRLALNLDRFGQLMECLLTLVPGANLKEPTQEADFWILALSNLPEVADHRAALSKLAQPTFYLQEGAGEAEPTMLLAALLLRAQGLSCTLNADTLELAVPILGAPSP